MAKTIPNNKYRSTLLKPAHLMLALVIVTLTSFMQSNAYAWENRNTLPETNNLNDVSATDSNYVVVGDAGTILSSPDAMTWTKQTSGNANHLRGIAWNGSQYVVVGDAGTVLTSPDGATWTSQSSGTVNNLMAAIWGNNEYLVMGQNGTILTSPDGVTWSAQNIGGSTATLYDAVWSTTQYIVVGANGTVLTSPDAVAWTPQNSGNSGDLYGIAQTLGDRFGTTQPSGYFLAVGYDRRILQSEDGINWIYGVDGTQGGVCIPIWPNLTCEAPTTSAGDYYDIARTDYSPTGYTAVGDNGRIYGLSMGGIEADLYAIANNVSGRIIVGTNGTILADMNAGDDTINTHIGGTATSLDTFFGVRHSVLDLDYYSGTGTKTAVLVDGPTHGLLTLNPDGTFIYSHNGDNSTTSDSFTYYMTDSTSRSLPATVSINIFDNNPPIANDDPNFLTVDKGSSATTYASILGNDTDPDGDALTIILATQPLYGTLTLNANGSLSYTHDGSATAFDSFTYYVNDGKETSSTAATVGINIFGNTAPVANDDFDLLSVNKGLSGNSIASVLINDSDADGDALVAFLATPPLYGTLTLNINGTFSYTHNGSETTNDSFTYYANDGRENSTTTATVNITINPYNNAPVADIIYISPYPAPRDEITFYGSSSYDVDGSIVSYEWNFGDGNIVSGVTALHSFKSEGIYPVTLTVTDNNGATSSTTTQVTVSKQGGGSGSMLPPIADTGGPYTTYIGSPTNFDGSLSSDPDGGSIISYLWDFGDGNFGTGSTPSHTYSTYGIYNVTLTVIDDEWQASTSTTTVYIAHPGAPTADPGGPYTGTKRADITFNASGSTDPDGFITSYAWDFGDGNGINVISPTHVHAYKKAGTYTVTLYVIDNSGLTHAASTTVEVTP